MILWKQERQMDLLSLHSWTQHPRPGLGAGPISCPSLASCREAARRETEKSDAVVWIPLTGPVVKPRITSKKTKAQVLVQNWTCDHFCSWNKCCSHSTTEEKEPLKPLGNRCCPLVSKRPVRGKAEGFVQRTRLLQSGLLHPSVPKMALGSEGDRRCYCHRIKAKRLDTPICIPHCRGAQTER